MPPKRKRSYEGNNHRLFYCSNSQSSREPQKRDFSMWLRTNLNPRYTFEIHFQPLEDLQRVHRKACSRNRTPDRRCLLDSHEYL